MGRGGFLGVSTFFTLSGFLITSLLLAERDATGRIALRPLLGAAGPGGSCPPRSSPSPGRRASALTAADADAAAAASAGDVVAALALRRQLALHLRRASPTPTCSARPRRCSTSGRWRSRSSSTCSCPRLVLALGCVGPEARLAASAAVLGRVAAVLAVASTATLLSAVPARRRRHLGLLRHPHPGRRDPRPGSSSPASSTRTSDWTAASPGSVAAASAPRCSSPGGSRPTRSDARSTPGV